MSERFIKSFALSEPTISALALLQARKVNLSAYVDELILREFNREIKEVEEIQLEEKN